MKTSREQRTREKGRGRVNRAKKCPNLPLHLNHHLWKRKVRMTLQYRGGLPRRRASTRMGSKISANTSHDTKRTARKKKKKRTSWKMKMKKRRTPKRPR